MAIQHSNQEGSSAYNVPAAALTSPQVSDFLNLPNFSAVIEDPAWRQACGGGLVRIADLTELSPDGSRKATPNYNASL